MVENNSQYHSCVQLNHQLKVLPRIVNGDIEEGGGRVIEDRHTSRGVVAIQSRSEHLL